MIGGPAASTCTKSGRSHSRNAGVDRCAKDIYQGGRVCWGPGHGKARKDPSRLYEDEMYAAGRKHVFVSEKAGQIVTSRRLQCAMLHCPHSPGRVEPFVFIIGEALEGAKRHAPWWCVEELYGLASWERSHNMLMPMPHMVVSPTSSLTNSTCEPLPVADCAA